MAEDITAPTTPVPTRTKDPPAGDIVQWQWLRTDPESAITPYAYAVGRTKGGNDVADWKVTSHTSLEFGPATLGQTLYISVKARSGFARWS